MGLDRTGVQPRELRDLGDRELLEVFQSEHRLLARRQRFDRFSKALPDLARVRSPLGRRVRMRRRVARPPVVSAVCSLMEIQDQTAALQPVLAPVDADPREPGLEARPFPELVQVPPRAQKALLRRAVGLPRVAQQAVSDPSDPALILADEVLEAPGVAGADLLDLARFVDN